MQGYLALCLGDGKHSTLNLENRLKTRFFFSYCTYYNCTDTLDTVFRKLFQTFHLVYLDGSIWLRDWNNDCIRENLKPFVVLYGVITNQNSANSHLFLSQCLVTNMNNVKLPYVFYVFSCYYNIKSWISGSNQLTNYLVPHWLAETRL